MAESCHADMAVPWFCDLSLNLLNNVNFIFIHGTDSIMRGKPFGRGAEDFLFTLYQLSHGEPCRKEVRLVDISSSLGVSRAAASRMAAYLSARGFISKTPYSSVSFTGKGRKFAESVALRHRVTEVFLHDVLGLEGSELEGQAHALEHAMTERTARRLDAFLGMPKKCPHGKKICR